MIVNPFFIYNTRKMTISAVTCIGYPIHWVTNLEVRLQSHPSWGVICVQTGNSPFMVVFPREYVPKILRNIDRSFLEIPGAKPRSFSLNRQVDSTKDADLASLDRKFHEKYPDLTMSNRLTSMVMMGYFDEETMTFRDTPMVRSPRSRTPTDLSVAAKPFIPAVEVSYQETIRRISEMCGEQSRKGDQPMIDFLAMLGGVKTIGNLTPPPGYPIPKFAI